MSASERRPLAEPTCSGTATASSVAPPRRGVRSRCLPPWSSCRAPTPVVPASADRSDPSGHDGDPTVRPWRSSDVPRSTPRPAASALVPLRPLPSRRAHPGGRHRAPQPLPELPLEQACRPHAGRPRVDVWLPHAADRAVAVPLGAARAAVRHVRSRRPRFATFGSSSSGLARGPVERRGLTCDPAAAARSRRCRRGR